MVTTWGQNCHLAHPRLCNVNRCQCWMEQTFMTATVVSMQKVHKMAIIFDTWEDFLKNIWFQFDNVQRLISHLQPLKNNSPWCKSLVRLALTAQSKKPKGNTLVCFGKDPACVRQNRDVGSMTVLALQIGCCEHNKCVPFGWWRNWTPHFHLQKPIGFNNSKHCSVMF